MYLLKPNSQLGKAHCHVLPQRTLLTPIPPTKVLWDAQFLIVCYRFHVTPPVDEGLLSSSC